jgi:protein SDA1
MIDNFVSDHCRPEVIALGLNTLRRICDRCPLALTSEQLSYLVAYREHKTSKTIVGAARALLNLFREKYPELLHKSERGKDAALAVQAGTHAVPIYSRVESAADDLAGIDRLDGSDDEQSGDDNVDEEAESGDEEDDDNEEDDEEEDEDEEEEEEASELEASGSEDEAEPKLVSIAAERVLSDEDFKRMRKRKRDDDSESESEPEDFLTVNPEQLMPSKKMRSSLSKKEQRVAWILHSGPRSVPT